MTKESSSSGFMKVIAFFDLLVKMAAAGALIGILVLLVQINGHIKDIASGEEVVRVSLLDSTPINVAMQPGNGGGSFSVSVVDAAGDSLGNPLYIRSAD
ncbi:hypothetical protein FDECE_16105 [Fusarium decemcellulare]|nr:hypothetical protein FDECE_16105 [Fusarium decemcellulare]